MPPSCSIALLATLCASSSTVRSSENYDSFTTMSLDFRRNSVCAFWLASVDSNCNTLCSKGSRDRLSHADAATGD